MARRIIVLVGRLISNLKKWYCLIFEISIAHYFDATRYANYVWRRREKWFWNVAECLFSPYIILDVRIYRYNAPQRPSTPHWLTDPNVTFFYIIFLFGWGLRGPPNYQGGCDGSLGDVSRWGLVGKSKFSVFLDVCTNSLECWGGGEKSHFSVLHYKFSRFSNFVHPRARWQTDLGYSRSSNISQVFIPTKRGLF